MTSRCFLDLDAEHLRIGDAIKKEVKQMIERNQTEYRRKLMQKEFTSGVRPFSVNRQRELEQILCDRSNYVLVKTDKISNNVVIRVGFHLPVHIHTGEPQVTSYCHS